MEAFEGVPSCRDLDIVVTVIRGQSSIVDVLRLPGTTATTLDIRDEYGRHDAGQNEVEEFPIRSARYVESTETDSRASQVSTEPSDSPLSRLNLTQAHPSSGDDFGRDRTRASLTRCISMDTMLASCLAAELRRSRNFESYWCRSLLVNNGRAAGKRTCWRHLEGVRENDCDRDCIEEESGRPVIYLWIRLKETLKYFKMEPDIRWSDRMLPLWVQRVQMEETFSWLSTLGGAYSSLGDNMYNCALEAGRVALRQLYLAERLGDATLRARCLLYIALSLMQRGQLAKAKRIVRQQYKFATSRWGCSDTRLVSMCLGIWHHLRHRYTKRREV